MWLFGVGEQNHRNLTARRKPSQYENKTGLINYTFILASTQILSDHKRAAANHRQTGEAGSHAHAQYEAYTDAYTIEAGGNRAAGHKACADTHAIEACCHAPPNYKAVADPGATKREDASCCSCTDFAGENFLQDGKLQTGIDQI